jgi:ferredoxin
MVTLRNSSSAAKRFSPFCLWGYVFWNMCCQASVTASAFYISSPPPWYRKTNSRLFSDTNNNYNEWTPFESTDSNAWQASSDDEDFDWEERLQRQQNGTFWSSFEPSNDNANTIQSTSTPLDDTTENWLDTIARLTADETAFNRKEAERADKLRQMQEYGFSPRAIQSTLGVALIEPETIPGMDSYRQDSYLEETDLQSVESHATVPVDPDTSEPTRSQMVYVDEHSCIGCTNCAMIAQSTFFMHNEHGRARVFQQWGDDDETIQVAIETCPVDCIHYVPYEELVRLEVERRDQNINFKARFGGEGGVMSHRVGGPITFTPPQRISGNMGSRCNNCPSRGCKDCPMYGVGKNPVFEAKELERKQRMAKRKLRAQRENEQKQVDL